MVFVCPLRPVCPAEFWFKTIRCSADRARVIPSLENQTLTADSSVLSLTGPTRRDSDWGGPPRTTEENVAWAAKRAAVAMAAAMLRARGADREHADSVLRVCDSIADELGVYGSERADLLAAAQLHDIGTVGIPDVVLDAPGAPDDRDSALLEEHTIVGEQIIQSLPDLGEVAQIVRHSHERWDGGGFPDGLSGEQIPLASRIVFCVESFYSLQADRPRGRGRTPQAAFNEVERGAGAQFDPGVVAALAKLAERKLLVTPSLLSGDAAGDHDTPRGPGLVARARARLASRVNAAMLELLFLLGLGGVFLANAVVAIVEPAAFREMVAASPMGGLMGDGAMVSPLIAVNDSLIGVAVIAAHRVRRLRAPVLAWAGVWLLVVTLMKFTTMG